MPKQNAVPQPSAEQQSEQLFKGLYDRYNRPIYTFFANRGLSREESRDLTQETFLAAFRGWRRFRGESSPETWIFSIAMNIWRSSLRDRRRIKRRAQEISLEGMREGPVSEGLLGLLPNANEEDRPLQRFLADERVRLLHNALDDLPDRMRQCVVLRLGQDLKYHEIAQVMQVSINTVRTQLFVARKKLKDQLADHFEDVVV